MSAEVIVFDRYKKKSHIAEGGDGFADLGPDDRKALTYDEFRAEMDVFKGEIYSVWKIDINSASINKQVLDDKVVDSDKKLLCFVREHAHLLIVLLAIVFGFLCFLSLFFTVTLGFAPVHPKLALFCLFMSISYGLMGFVDRTNDKR